MKPEEKEVWIEVIKDREAKISRISAESIKLKSSVLALQQQNSALRKALRECGDSVGFHVDPEDGFDRHCLVSQYVVGSVNKAKAVLAENRELVDSLRKENALHVSMIQNLNNMLTDKENEEDDTIIRLTKENDKLRWANAAKDCSFTVIDALTNKCKELEFALKESNLLAEQRFKAIENLKSKVMELEKSKIDLSRRLDSTRGICESIHRLKLEKIYQKLGKDVVESWDEAQT